jgi:hypothetical protein
MNKRIIHGLLLTTFAVFAAPLAAQTTDQDILEDQRVAEARAMMQAGRDEIIEFEMGLTEAEAERFWPLYKSYRAEVAVVRDRYAAMIGGYLRAYEADDVSDTYAEGLLNDWLEYQEDMLKLQKQHVRKFRKVLPMRKVVRFYQLENKMDAEIDAELAVFVPLMEAD